jgi:hypothetical protein
MRRARVLPILLLLLGAAPAARAETPVHPAEGSPSARPLPAPELAPAAPFHGRADGIAWGGHGELRLGYDRIRGVANPEWFSIERMGGFLEARPHPRIEIAAEGAWDRATDDFVLERGELGIEARDSWQVHGGIFLAPLGRTNLSHDAPEQEFGDRSLVATQLIGVPYAEVGAGVRGRGRLGRGTPLEYELDVVTGYDDGLVMDSPGGTRLPRGRNNYGDKNAIPALAGRVALHPSPDTELGIAAQSGPYNATRIGGVTVDRSRFVHLVVADAGTGWAGFRFFSEAALALIDVPPGLRPLYATQQWGGSVEASRILFRPLFRSWRETSLTAAFRADALDLDRAAAGDSRIRLALSLNLRRLPIAVARFGWYYEIQRDRFNNDTPSAGLTFTAASYF